MNSSIVDLLTPDVIKAFTHNKTKSEKETIYFVGKVAFARTLITRENLEEHINSIYNKNIITGNHLTKKGALIHLDISVIYGYSKDINDAKNNFRDEIYKVLEISKDNTQVSKIMQEIKYLWEFEIVLHSLKYFSYISSLEQRDRKKIQREKKKKIKAISIVLDDIRGQNLPIQEESIKAIRDMALHEEKYMLNVNYETTLHHAREILEEELEETGPHLKTRAKKISQILSFIQK